MTIGWWGEKRGASICMLDMRWVFAFLAKRYGQRFQGLEIDLAQYALGHLIEGGD